MNSLIDDLRIHQAPATLRALAVDRLRGAIIAGRFQGGDRLVERTLCDQLGVSRSVVREVIRTLEAEGLVETLARSGPVVARLDWRQAAQIYDIRRLLEAEAAAGCALLADGAVKERLQAALAAHVEAQDPREAAAQTEALARQATRALDKAASKGVIHKNQAANRKSSISKKAAAL